MSCVPGLSPVSFGSRAVEVIQTRKTKIQSWFLDMSLIMGYWGGGTKRAYHHTAPVNTLYALHEALIMVQAEGLEQAWARHQYHHQALKAGLEAMGIQFVVEAAARLPQLNLITVPEGIDEAAVRTRLLNEYSIEIGAGLGALAGKVWRIGLMGHACNTKNVLICLGALDAVLSSLQAPIESGVAVAAAQTFYQA
jgi:alanine-glyoxylate transaminase/serine-glyoxylate transaminase/serine-pyruvate transaminase